MTATVEPPFPPRHETILAALASIPDPELGLDIVSLGLISDVHVSNGGAVRIQYTLTRLGCPAAPMFHEAIVRRVAEVQGVQSVEAELVMFPPWTPERMSAEARTELMGA
jgi:metal-sulfur cluster biosynthetic enzyme